MLPKGQKGRACLMEENRNEFFYTESKKTNMVNQAFILLIIIYTTWIGFSTKRFISGLCPRGRMWCMGRYRRNVLTLEGTYLFLIANMFYRVVSAIATHYATQLSPAVHFWTWNINAGLWGELSYLLLPWLLKLPPPSRNPIPASQFYVRKPALQPRPANGISWRGKIITESNHVEERFRLEPIRISESLSNLYVRKPALEPLQSRTGRSIGLTNNCDTGAYLPNVV